jgi:hypothetical protein
MQDKILRKVRNTGRRQAVERAGRKVRNTGRRQAVERG